MIRSSGVARLATHCYSQLIAAGKFSPRTNILNINIEREHIPHICSPFQHNEMELHKNLFFFHLICNQFSSLFYFGFFVYCFATKKNFVRSREFALCVHFWKHIQLNFQFIDVFLHLNKLLLSNQKGGLFLCVFEKFFLFMDFIRFDAARPEWDIKPRAQWVRPTSLIVDSYEKNTWKKFTTNLRMR